MNKKGEIKFLDFICNDEFIYLAAIIDPAYFHISQVIQYKTGLMRRWQVRVRVTTTNKKLLNWLLSKFGGSSIGKKNIKNIYYWEINGVNILNILNKVLPYLKFSTEKALLFIDYYKNCYVGKGKRLTDEMIKKRLYYIDKLKHLNEIRKSMRDE